MRYRVQHDDEVWCGDLCLFVANSETAAHEFVKQANATFEKLELYRPNTELSRIADQLQAWLTDNTDDDFSEAPNIDGARLLILEHIGDA